MYSWFPPLFKTADSTPDDSPHPSKSDGKASNSKILSQYVTL